MESCDLQLWTRIGTMNRSAERLLHMQQKFAVVESRFMESAMAFPDGQTNACRIRAADGFIVDGKYDRRWPIAARLWLGGRKKTAGESRRRVRSLVSDEHHRPSIDDAR